MAVLFRSSSVQCEAGLITQLSVGQVRHCNYSDHQHGRSLSSQLEVFIFHHLPPPPCPPAHSSLWCVVVRGTHSNHSHTLQSSIHSTQNILSEPVCKQPSELTHPTTEHSTLNKIFCFSRIIFLVFREIEKRSRTVHRGQ